MARTSSWFSVGPGVSVFRRHKTWWADIRTGERRYKRNLRTHDYKEAAARALDLAKEPAPNPVVVWSTAVETYLTDYSPLYHAAATKAKAQSVLSEFGSFLVEKLNAERVSLASANRDRVEEWMRRCSERVTAATVRRRVRAHRGGLPARDRSPVRRLQAPASVPLPGVRPRGIATRRLPILRTFSPGSRLEGS